MKKILPTVLILLGMIVLLSLMTITYADIEQASNQVTGNLSTLLILMSLYAFLFGMLMEYRGLSRVIKGDIRLQSTLLVVTSVLMVFVFIPATSWIAWFRLDHPLYLEALIIPETHMILAVLAGTLFVRSFTKESRTN
ncbi:hypothetical protein GCM10012290_16550 [Halolactibacillus alkaliphilus]|uniref:Uncharacterized protein n=1 Tax=Halolactibacillus alkaliphilus TaxID=442899 RepID=A0A511X1Z9_9BACI|nr:hypothetical protein [Halolactibacillus alkaliphilus]GEN56972.1 hypothetical protein HAL01_14360 [Halolactibacillus alkaliphilus]GGN71550.1 hypothetical protein GCM10012290_16550 [Halolactibacillus alkaliphilus]SFO84632.1 hypothetical protein SAMN05720591_1165 [Halolactibacillus alkaliphilus]